MFRVLARSHLVVRLILASLPLCGGCTTDVTDAASPPAGGGGSGGGEGGGGGSGEGCPAEAHEGESCSTQGMTCHYDASPCPIYLECNTFLVDLTWMTTGPNQGDSCDPAPGQVCTYSQSIGDTCQVAKWIATCGVSGTFDVDETTTNPCSMFECGTTSCEKGVESCQVGIFDDQYTYSCEPLPPTCTEKADCACFGDIGVECTCKESDAGDLTISCFTA